MHWKIPFRSDGGRSGTNPRFAVSGLLPHRRLLARNKQREPDGSDSIPPRNTSAATGILAQRRLDSLVPAGVKHNIINTGNVQLKLYTLYALPNHRDGVVNHTRADAEADNEHFDGKTTE
jgi:hypothetical protein